MRDRAALLAWSGACALALFGLVLAVDRVVAEDPVAQGFAAYALVTGIGSIGLAFVNRRPTRLGPWAWTIMLAWAAHLWGIVWLVNIELADVPEPLRKPLPLVALGVLFLVVETFAVGLLRRRLQRAD